MALVSWHAAQFFLCANFLGVSVFLQGCEVEFEESRVENGNETTGGGKQPRGNCKVVVVGSSVAKGWGASNNYGWAGRLRDELSKATYRLELINVAFPGDDTKKARPRLDDALRKYQPQLVIFGLSLANEGLTQTRSAADAKRVADEFYQGYHDLAATAKREGADVIFGGLYPHGSYSSTQKDQLLESRARFMEEASLSGGIPYIDFFSTTGSSSTGHWNSGYQSDNGHPNSLGHQKMFDAIDMSIFAPHSCGKMLASYVTEKPINASSLPRNVFLQP